MCARWWFGLVATMSACDGGPGNGSSAEGTAQVSCEPTGNVLRWTCTVTLDAARPASLTWTPRGGGAAQTAESSATTKEHTFSVLFLHALETYDVVAESPPAAPATTHFTTEDVPQRYRIDYEISGTSTAPRLLHQTPCAGLVGAVVSDTEGKVAWFQTIMDVPGDLLSAETTEDGTLLVTTLAPPQNALRELDWNGNFLLVVDSFVDTPAAMHHDAFKKNGLVYVLWHQDVERAAGTYKEDGFYVVASDGTILKEWRLYDHHTPPEPLEPFTGTKDYSHANSIEVDDDLGVLISFRHLSTVMYVEGDIDSPEFGEVRWSLVGQPTEPDQSNMLALFDGPGGLPGFEMQHHARFRGPDRLTMFDNRNLGLPGSRVLELALDVQRGTATIDATYPLDLSCGYQGSTYYSAAGNPIATCGPLRQVLEWDAGSPQAPRFNMKLSCATGANNTVPRAFPLPP